MIHWAVPGSRTPVSCALTTFAIHYATALWCDCGYVVISTNDCKTFRLVSVITVERAKHRAGGAGPTTPTLVGPKILSFMVKALYFQSYGRTNNCQIQVLYKWSDQSSTPSATPETYILITSDMESEEFF